MDHDGLDGDTVLLRFAGENLDHFIVFIGRTIDHRDLFRLREKLLDEVIGRLDWALQDACDIGLVLGDHGRHIQPDDGLCFDAVLRHQRDIGSDGDDEIELFAFEVFDDRLLDIAISLCILDLYRNFGSVMPVDRFEKSLGHVLHRLVFDRDHDADFLALVLGGEVKDDGDDESCQNQSQ